jgi:hypothetical protein
MSPAEARAELAARQADLVRALVGVGAPPVGLDTARLQAARVALAGKRCREAAQSWPALSRALEERFADQFAEFAAQTPLPGRGGPLADGRAFARHLAAHRELPDAARLEVLVVDLRFVSIPAGLLPRRGVVVKATFLRQSRRLVLAVRLPLLGEKWLSVPLGWFWPGR